MVLLAGLGLTGSGAKAAAADCSSGCLLGFTNRYLDAMVAHNPAGLPLAPDLKATENGKPLKLGEGLWKTAKVIVYRQSIADPVAGQAAFYGVVQELDGPALFMLRLAIRNQQIAEVETLVARKGAHAFFSPESLTSVKAIWNQVVPEAERSPRAGLIDIADRYFEGIEKHSGDNVPFHPDCNRTENGIQTTNNSSTQFVGPSCSTGISEFTYITKVRGRRYPVVDEARGLVVGIVHFDIPGTPSLVPATGDVGTTLGQTPRTLLLYELFKIEAGRIREILAFMANAPLGASNGWEK